MITERLGLLGRTALVLLSALLLQVSVMSDLPAFNAVGDLMLLMAIAAGSVGGPDRGATYGFAAGLAFDLMVVTPFGLYALTFAVAGYLAGWGAAWLVQPRWWFHVATAAGVSIVGVVLSVVVSRVLGVSIKFDEIVQQALVVALWNAALIIPMRRIWFWVFGEEEPGRFRVAMQ